MSAPLNQRRIGITIEDGAPAPLGAYSHAVKAGPFVFVSGQGARDPQTGIEQGVTLDENGRVLAYDIEAQTRAVIANLKTVLAAVRLTLADVVDVSVFLADMGDFERFNKVYAEFFAGAQPPARTTVAAARLPGRNYIEIKAIALAKED